jgi:hypothetical protein
MTPFRFHSPRVFALLTLCFGSLFAQSSTSVTVTSTPLTIPIGTGATETVTISGLTAPPATLGLGGTACVNIAGCVYKLPTSGGSVGFEFLNVTSTSALLVAVATSSIPQSATPYSIPITIGTTTVGSFSLTVPLTAQTISFSAIATQTAGTTLTLSATASSGLAVSYSSSTTGVCTVSGSTVTLAAAGSCTITASQAGNSTYAAATGVTQSFTVNASPVTVTSTPLTIPINTGATETVAISGLTAAPSTLGLGGVPCVNLSGCVYQLPNKAGAVGFEFINVTNTSALLIAVSTASAVPSATPYSIPITIGATTVGSFSLTVPLAAQTISFNAISAQGVGATVTLSASASSGLAVSYSSGTTAVCTVSGSTVTLAAAGTCTITASQPGNSTYAAATPVTQSFPVASKSQTITFSAIPDQLPSSTVALSAAATSGLAVAFTVSPSSVCTLSGSTVSLAAAGTCIVVASQPGNAAYAAAAPVTELITVSAQVWSTLGPVNILNGNNATGVSGTCSDALYMGGNPNTIMMAATHNNSAPGIKITTDGGATWSIHNSGLPDTHITALATDVAAANSYFAASGNGVYHTADNATTWQTSYNTAALGGVQNSFFWISIGGVQTLIAGTTLGIVYQPAGTYQWSLEQPPSGAVQIYNVSGMVSGGTTVLYASVGLNDPNYQTHSLYRITIANGVWTWTSLPLQYIITAVDPSNSNHIVGSAAGTYQVRQSVNGGQSDSAVTDSSGNTYGAWFVNFDPRDTTGQTYLFAGDGYYYRTTNGGSTFVQLLDNFSTIHSESISIGTDVQRLLFPTSNSDTLLCSDQGLFYFNFSQNSLVNRAALANNSIVVSAAVSHVPGQAAPNLLTTLWDWAPAASWDGGQTWPASANGFYWYADTKGTAAPLMGEGGQVYTMNAAADGNPHVFQEAGYYTAYASSDGGYHFTQSTLPAIATSGNYRSFVYDTFSSAQTVTSTGFQDNGVGYIGVNEYTSAGQNVSGLILTTSNYGSTWTALPSPFASGEMLAGLAVDPNDPTHLILSSYSRLFQSHNTGQTWVAAASLPGNTHSPVSQFSFQRGTSGNIVALNWDGELLQSVNGGSTWTVLSPYTAALAPALISYSLTGNSLVVVATSAYPAQRAVLLSHNNGSTWENITGDIQTTQINRATWDGSDLYLATSGQGILKLAGLDAR